MGGFGTGPGLQTKAAKAYRKLANKWYPQFNPDDGFYYNWWNPAWALTTAMEKINGDLSAGHQKLWAAMPRRPQRRVRCHQARQEPAGDSGSVSDPVREEGRRRSRSRS